MTVARRALGWFLVLLVAAGAAAQDARDSVSLAGVVVNSVTGEAVPRALVEIWNYPTPKATGAPPPAPFHSSAFTDAAGTFRFDGLEKSTYTISARKPEFTNSGAVKPVKLTASAIDMNLRLAPLGVIQGKVTDGDGQPMRGVTVLVLNSLILDGTRTVSQARSVTTDDRGMYRTWNFMPGRYYVKASGKSGGTYLYAGDNGPVYSSFEIFAPTYYGGSASLAGATAIEIQAGSEARADIELKLAPAHRIRGSLENFVPRRLVKFELLNGEEDVASASRVSVNGDTGRFEIQDVAAGSYTLRAAQGDDTVSETPVTVGGADVNGLVVRLAGGVEWTGQARVLNPAPASPKSDDDEGDAENNRFAGETGFSCSPMLSSAGLAMRQTYPAEEGQDGQFRFARVLPGRYRLAVNCFGGYAVSAMAGSRDLLADPFITIEPGVAPPPLEIAEHRGGGTIQGKIDMQAAGEGEVGKLIGVLLVPQFVPSGGPQMGSAFTGAMPAQFGFTGLPPGDYLLFAFGKLEDVEFRNPEFLRGLSNGTAVHVQENGTAQVTISAVVK
jgi:protocatechuate 3,4-dioxygenase beta subunit